MAKDTGTQAAPAKAAATTNSETDLDKPKVEDGKEVGANKVDLEGTRDVVKERLDKLSEANEEGHAKNMEKIEKAHAEDEQGKPDPKLGREDNGNTPHIDKHGNKSWLPPGVAGAKV